MNGTHDAPFADDLRSASEPRTIRHVGPEDIFAPVPAPDWLCQSLCLARSSGVACFGGYGYSGKTVVAQSIALSVAAGREVFGLFSCRRGRVLHLDYEQGSRLTRERYQRLARGMGITLADLGDRLRLAVFPDVYLDSADAHDVFARALEGFDLAIVDALRGAAPTVDENTSGVRHVLDLLARQSERVGTLPLVMLHARKPPSGPRQGEDGPGDARYTLRGSSALYDALTELFVFAGQKGRPVVVRHEKERLYGREMPDFGLRIEDVASHESGRVTDPRWGLRVTHMDREQLAQQAPSATLSSQADRILAWLASHNGGTFVGTKGALCEAIGMQRTAFFAAFSTLEGVRVSIDRKPNRITLAREPSP
jgi:hypothetical protein